MISNEARKPVTAYDVMDGMRALAAFVVLASHARNIIFQDAASDLSRPWKLFYLLTGLGHQAVMIFFVLSGYWITKSVARQFKDDHFDWKTYLIDRVSRLWIVLMPSLMIGGVLDFVGRYGIAAPIYYGVQGTSIIKIDVAGQLSSLCFLGNIAFMQTLLVAPFGSNGSLWSLANEFWYYVWFPAMYGLLRGRVSSPFMIVVALASMILFRKLAPGYICWLVGSLLFYATSRATKDVETLARRLVALVGAGLVFALALLLTKWPGLGLDESITDIFISGAFALFVHTLIRCPWTYSPLIAPLCRYGARSSYSLYAVHLPLIVLLAALFMTPARRLEPSGLALIYFVGVSLVAIGYAYLYSRCTEAHTSIVRNWLKHEYRRLVDAAPRWG